MDDQRFDSLTRALATGTSRRSGLRLLAGAGAALLALAGRREPAAARTVYLTAGEACYDSSQCRAADAPLVCADNGFTYDGPLNCCTFEGSRCFADEGCCGSASCIGGFCSNVNTWLSPGDRCQNSGQCFSDSSPVYCDYVAATDDYRCCNVEGGGRCFADSECCGWLSCIGGTCRSGGYVPACSGEGCDCWQGPYDADPCDAGLVCCLYDENNGTCLPLYTCTGGGAPGDECPRYCLPGPTQCPSCVSGYCSASGYCG